MASIYNDIRAALETKLGTIPGLPAIAYENVPFETSTGTSFIKVQFIPTLRRPAVRGLNPQQRYQGVFSLTVYCPDGNGPGLADGFANTLIESFEATTKIDYTNASAETITVSIDYAERQLALMDSPWYYIPVDIGWYTYAT